MFKPFRHLFIHKKQHNKNDKYIEIPESEMNEELKRHILELELLGEEYTEVLQNKYTNKFERYGKKNLKIWVCRDIDGEEIEDLSSEECLEREYRSQVAINFDGFTAKEDAYAYYIQLWYYFGGHSNGTGTLYNLSVNNLENDIEETLEKIFKQT
ncbi:hypothetical protein SFC65_18930 [Priestia filamentosa]|uniref:hypothetical protein n=1 Tax=Priestia filamentosa TaxID=1402861 RepID=UPI0039828DEB